MTRIKKELAPISLLLLIPIVNIFYPLLNKPTSGVHNLATSLDAGIPLIKIFSLPYIFWYIFIPATLFYFCYKDRDTYYRSTACIIVGLLISFIIYSFFQTTVPRPTLMGSDLLTRILRFVYRTDHPYNCFPSIHALTCYLMIKSINNSPIKNMMNKLIIIGTSSLIIASTLFIKQHVISDLAFAMFLGEIIFTAVTNTRIDACRLYLRKMLFPAGEIPRTEN